MIHVSKLNIITAKKDHLGDLVPFTFKAISLKGEIISGHNCVCTSSHFASRTKNIKFLDSGEFRKFKNISFIEFNGIEVTL